MQRLYQAFFARLPVRPLANDGELHILNPAEVAFIRRRHRQALIMSAGLSVAGFLAYFLPVYGLPQLFPSAPLTLPIVGAIVMMPTAVACWLPVRWLPLRCPRQPAPLRQHRAGGFRSRSSSGNSPTASHLPNANCPSAPSP